jgi:hypothetical protein
MDGLLWLLLPLFVAAGSALLAFFIMQSRMDVALAKEREALAEAHAKIRAQQITMEERVKAAEESTRRKALDELMQEFRVEERSYMRESKSAFLTKKSMILQERLFFRNIPISNWVEHEMVVEDSGDANALPKGFSIFNTKNLGDEGQAAVQRLIDSMSNGSMKTALSPLAGD